MLLQWFLQRRMCGVSLILVSWLQVLWLCWAATCSLTRITDNRHHWWDVVAGLVLGIIAGIYTVSTWITITAYTMPTVVNLIFILKQNTLIN